MSSLNTGNSLSAPPTLLLEMLRRAAAPASGNAGAAWASAWASSGQRLSASELHEICAALERMITSGVPPVDHSIPEVGGGMGGVGGGVDGIHSVSGRQLQPSPLTAAMHFGSLSLHLLLLRRRRGPSLSRRSHRPRPRSARPRPRRRSGGRRTPLRRYRIPMWRPSSTGLFRSMTNGAGQATRQQSA